jgi:hypothetical protein
MLEDGKNKALRDESNLRLVKVKFTQNNEKHRTFERLAFDFTA